MKKDSITLKIVTAFVVSGSTNEWGNDEVKGYYKDQEAAAIKAKNCGWYGSPGSVTNKQMLQDGAGNLYSFESVGKYTDIETAEHQKMLDNIKAKLTPEEWEFYNKFHKQK